MNHLSLDHLRLFIDTVFPHFCPICKDEGLSSGLCPKCWNTIDIISSPVCKICGCPQQHYPEMLCGKCIMKKPYFDICRSFAIYSKHIKPLITSLKEKICINRSNIIAQWIYTCIPHDIHIDYIVMIPSPITRTIYRGFNPMSNITSKVSELSKIPVKNLLSSRYYVETQKNKTLKQRQLNIKNKFYCKQDLSNKVICIIDDVLTTGSTLNEASKILKKYNAKYVICVTALRTFNFKF